MSASSLQSSGAAFAGQSLGAIATAVPGATALFRRYKLDFCCGGGVTLADAATVKNIPCAEIEAELTALAAAAAPQPAPQTTAALIDWIETRYHETHRRELPELIRLARRVEAVHKTHPAVPHGLAALLEDMLSELTRISHGI